MRVGAINYITPLMGSVARDVARIFGLGELLSVEAGAKIFGSKEKGHPPAGSFD